MTFIILKQLYHFQIDHLNYDKDVILTELRQDRSYTYEDEITCSKDCLQNYEEKVLQICVLSNLVIIVLARLSRF